MITLIMLYLILMLSYFFLFFFIGTAAVAKAMSNYLDSLLGDPQKTYMKKYFPINMEYLGEYPDVASFLFIMTIACN